MKDRKTEKGENNTRRDRVIKRERGGVKDRMSKERKVEGEKWREREKNVCPL